MKRSPGSGRRLVRLTSARARVPLGIALATGILAALGVVWPASATAATAAPPTPHCPLPDEQLNPSDNPYNGSDPTRKLLYYNAFRMARYPCDYPKDFRTILLYPDAILLVEAGKVYRPITFENRGRLVPIEQIIKAIDEPAWISRTADGVVTIDAAFIQMPGTAMVIKSPAVKQVRLVNRAHAFLGGMNATVLIDSVNITSWDPRRDGPDIEPLDGRPFILYGRGARMDILDSDISYLGSDRSGGGYGISWQNGNATGSAIGNDFHHNFFGGYTSGAKDIVFRNNKFRDNDEYGLDPHDYSTGLIIENNEVYGNGKHGIILSNYCTGATIRGNDVHDNEGNGIVIDKLSDSNRIENNTVVNNHKDGIVALNSGLSSITGNTVKGNRVGIRANLTYARNLKIENNTLEGNVSGIRVYDGAHDITLTSNTVIGSSDAAVSIAAPATTVNGLTISGGRVGINVMALATLNDVDITNVPVGMSVRKLGVVELNSVTIDATDIGIRADRGAQVVRASTTVAARQQFALTGAQPTWKHLLPLVGAAAVLLAVVLQVFSHLFNGRRGREWLGNAPTIVWNVA